VTIPPDDRSLYAVASQWVSRVMTVSMEMVVPGLIGLWLDERIGSTPLLALAGFGLGMTTAIWHLLRMTDATRGGRESSAGRRDGSEGQRSK